MTNSFNLSASMASDDKLKRTIKIENMEMRQSPPKAIVDCSPLQPAISKNKEGNFEENFFLFSHVWKC